MQSVQNISDLDRLSTTLALGDSPSGPISLHYSSSLLDEIRRAVVDKFLSIPRGGLEIGGVFFGTTTDTEIRLLAYRPLEIEYVNGPSFTLSSTDESNLSQLLAASQSDPELKGMDPVGWYHSHTRSDVKLSDRDVAVHQDYFPRPEQFALVIKPHKFEPAQAGFFLRDADGSLPGGAPRAMVLLSPPGRNSSDLDGVPAPAPIADSPPAPEVEDTPAAESPVVASSGREDILPSVTGLAAPHSSRRYWTIASVAMVMFCVAGAGFLQNRSPVSRESSPMWVHLSDADHQLTITWNRSSPAVAHARTAEILIFDGGKQTAKVPLNGESLSRGTIIYPRRSGNVEVRMRVQPEADRSLEQVVRFNEPVTESGLVPVPAPAPVVPVKPEERDTEMLRVKAEMERLKRELVRVQPDGTRARSVPTAQAVQATDGESKRVSAPVAQPTVASSPSTADIRPPVLTSQVQLNPPVLTPPTYQAPPVPKPRVLPTPVQQQTVARGPASGRTIWTGLLPKGGLLLVDGSRPSVGTLSAPLPQRAAILKVYAADLGDSGIVVYSGVARRNAIEPPSAGNGWNLTTYRADAKRARSVTVLEYPRPQNGWKRLLVRSEDRSLSMLVIDWTETSADTER